VSRYTEGYDLGGGVKITYAAMRKYWRIAMWESLRRGYVRDAREAWVHSRMEKPPRHWKNGYSLVEVDEAGY
jgi:hypothetical protein